MYVEWTARFHRIPINLDLMVDDVSPLPIKTLITGAISIKNHIKASWVILQKPDLEAIANTKLRDVPYIAPGMLVTVRAAFSHCHH